MGFGFVSDGHNFGVIHCADKKSLGITALDEGGVRGIFLVVFGIGHAEAAQQTLALFGC